MATREKAPNGAPCWMDLWTSDVEGAAEFYAGLFGWEAQEPSPEFGGYFMFTRNGVPIAGGMGDMGEMRANNTWKVYLSTEDVSKTIETAETEGAVLLSPSMPVADLGIQAVLSDPTGAIVGAWQPGTFPGFTVLDEHGAPSWFELHTRDYATALDFYRSVFGWDLESIGDTDEFRYSVVRSPGSVGELGGVLDAKGFLPESVPASWVVYWEVEDVTGSVEAVTKLGGTVQEEPQDTPYGRMATVSDPFGAQFKLRTGPR
jgi:uncharacterized protein